MAGEQKFEQPERRMAFEEMMFAIRQAQERVARLEQAIRAAVPDWSLAEVVTAFDGIARHRSGLGGGFLAELGDLSRFRTPREVDGLSRAGALYGTESAKWTRRCEDRDSPGRRKSGNYGSDPAHQNLIAERLRLRPYQLQGPSPAELQSKWLGDENPRRRRLTKDIRAKSGLILRASRVGLRSMRATAAHDPALASARALILARF